MSKYINRAKVVQMLRDKGDRLAKMALDYNTPPELVAAFSDQAYAYDRAADLVETFNDPDQTNDHQKPTNGGPCAFCNGRGEYEAQYGVQACFKCNGSGII